MKILFLLDTFPKISETFILDQITGLIELGVDVKILATWHSAEATKHEDFTSYKLIEKVKYFDPPLTLIQRLFNGTIILGKAFLKKKIASYKKPLFQRSLRDLFFIDSFLKFGECDIIHAHFGKNGLLATQLKESKCFSGKLITTFHGYDLSRVLQEKGNKIYDKLFSYGDLFLPVSDFFRYRLLALGCPPEKIIVHKMGVYTDRFMIAQKKPIDKIRLLSIARLTEKKGIYYAIKAFRKVLNNFRSLSIEYNIIGDGEKRNDLLKLIKEESLSDNVKILGWQTQESIRRHMNDSHLFILPSITSSNGDMEGIPVALMEAMASGLPVITTNHSGIPELVKDGVSGYIVPEKDVDLLADRIEFLIRNPRLWPQMGRQGRTFVELNHNNKLLNQRLYEIFRNLLNG